MEKKYVRDRADMLINIRFALEMANRKGTLSIREFKPIYAEVAARDPRAVQVSFDRIEKLMKIALLFEHLPQRNGVAGLERLVTTLTMTECEELVPSYLSQETRIAILEAVEDGVLPHYYTHLHKVVLGLRDGATLKTMLQQYQEEQEKPLLVEAPKPSNGHQTGGYPEGLLARAAHVDRALTDLETLATTLLQQVGVFRAEMRSFATAQHLVPLEVLEDTPVES